MSSHWFFPYLNRVPIESNQWCFKMEKFWGLSLMKFFHGIWGWFKTDERPERREWGHEGIHGYDQDSIPCSLQKPARKRTACILSVAWRIEVFPFSSTNGQVGNVSGIFATSKSTSIERPRCRPHPTVVMFFFEKKNLNIRDIPPEFAVKKKCVSPWQVMTLLDSRWIVSSNLVNGVVLETCLTPGKSESWWSDRHCGGESPNPMDIHKKH